MSTAKSTGMQHFVLNGQRKWVKLHHCGSPGALPDVIVPVHTRVWGFYGSFCQSLYLTWFAQPSLGAGIPCACCTERLLSAGPVAHTWAGLARTTPWCRWRPRRRRLCPPCPGRCPTGPAARATRSPGTAYSTWSASSVHWWRRCLFSCHLVLPVKIKKHHRAACSLGNKEWIWKHLARCWAGLPLGIQYPCAFIQALPSDCS